MKRTATEDIDINPMYAVEEALQDVLDYWNSRCMDSTHLARGFDCEFTPAEIAHLQGFLEQLIVSWRAANEERN